MGLAILGGPRSPHDELLALCSIIHTANQSKGPTRSRPRRPAQPAPWRTEAKSYAERLFTYHTVDALTDTDASNSTLSPADTEGVTWHSDAIRHVVTEARGYPYFLQQYRTRTPGTAPQEPRSTSTMPG
ncbi:MAG: hypothetical protein R2742_11135 [Micropruina glycogenica]